MKIKIFCLIMQVNLTRFRKIAERNHIRVNHTGYLEDKRNNKSLNEWFIIQSLIKHHKEYKKQYNIHQVKKLRQLRSLQRASLH